MFITAWETQEKTDFFSSRGNAKQPSISLDLSGVPSKLLLLPICLAVDVVQEALELIAGCSFHPRLIGSFPKLGTSPPFATPSASTLHQLLHSFLSPTSPLSFGCCASLSSSLIVVRLLLLSEHCRQHDVDQILGPSGLPPGKSLVSPRPLPFSSSIDYKAWVLPVHLTFALALLTCNFNREPACRLLVLCPPRFESSYT